MTKTRIAIIGGGIGGLTAAYELTKGDLNEKYEITVYQMGWRLGGKCATGRNIGRNMRIEEHGIHAFSGSYYNALSMMKDVYDQLDRPDDHPLADFKTAFPTERSSFMWEYHNHILKKWASHFPPRPFSYTNHAEFVRGAAAQSTLQFWIHAMSTGLRHFLSPQPKPTETTESSWRPTSRTVDTYLSEIDLFEQNLERLTEGGINHVKLSPVWLDSLTPIRGTLTGAETLSEAEGLEASPLGDFERSSAYRDPEDGKIFLVLPDGTGRKAEISGSGTSIMGVPDTTETVMGDDLTIEAIQPWANEPGEDEIAWDLLRGFLVPLPTTETVSHEAISDEERRNLIRIEFLQVILRGVRDDKLQTRGFASIDDEDFDDWLIRHGASEQLMASPLVTSTMFVTYQFPDGDIARKPTMSASSFVQWILRTFNYLDAPYYLFEAGSGETLIMPLYELLKQRGVTFKLFHELTDIHLSSDQNFVDELNFNVQAKPSSGTYDPIIHVKGLDAWPNEPILSQLDNGDAYEQIDLEAPGAIRGETKTLKKDKDFDHAILAIPPRAIMSSCPSLIESGGDWADLQKMSVTATQSMQLWLTETVEDLTNHSESFFVSGNYRTGLHGIAEFDGILKYENWPDHDRPKGLLYFSGVMTAPHLAGNTAVRVLANSKAYGTAEMLLGSLAGEVFPNALPQTPINTDFAFNYDYLYSQGSGSQGADRLTDQYVRGNALPSELYTQAPPGTKRLRIDPLKPPQSNMTVAGDWVDTRLNVGSVEGAVIGGRLAACFIEPTLDADHILGIQI